jgi:hypothetical protein
VRFATSQKDGGDDFKESKYTETQQNQDHYGRPKAHGGELLMAFNGLSFWMGHTP